MATVTPEQMKKALSSLSALEGLASGYCDLQDGFDTSKGIAENVRQVLAALAAPPAENRPAAPPRDVLDGPRPTTALDREYQKALAVIHDQQQEIERLKARAQAPPASDPPGLSEDRCAVCGWPLDPNGQMCRRGFCSMRPMPERAADPARAIAEYAAVWGGMARPTIDQWKAQLSKQTTRQSDPPGLVALVDRHIAGLRAAYGREGIDIAMREMGKIRIEALEGFRDTLRPASPQAETTKGDA